MADWYIPPLRVLFPGIQWYAQDTSVCLTFDDGPHPVATPAVLKILRQENIKATFFLLGDHAERYPDIVKELVNEGHAIGNHTRSHQTVFLAEESRLQQEVDSCQRILTDVAGTTPTLFRPPYGMFDPSTAGRMRKRNLRTVLFSVNAWDFSDTSVERIVRRTTERLRAGDIIVLHDSETTATRISEYLPRIIENIHSRGLTPGLV